MGAPLPKASLGTTDKTISFRGYCFGQASSHAGFIYYSGGATLAVNNTYKTRESGPLNKYEYVSFTKIMRLDPITDTWTTVFMVRPDLNQVAGEKLCGTKTDAEPVLSVGNKLSVSFHTDDSRGARGFKSSVWEGMTEVHQDINNTDNIYSF